MSQMIHLPGPAAIDLEFHKGIGVVATAVTAFAAKVDVGEITTFGVTIGFGEGLTLHIATHQARELVTQLSAALYDYDITREEQS